MHETQANIKADAVALQERDEFTERGWVKVIAPAKVNLHLAIGARRPDGYHDAVSIMHALTLHDVVFIRRKLPDSPEYGMGEPLVRMVATGDVAVPDVPSQKNLAYRAIMQLADRLGRPSQDADLEVRIEKSIPAEGGLGGGSSDAAAALAGAARLWGLPEDEETLAHCEAVARNLGADVAFFLRGGCAYYEGAGELFAHALEPSRQAVALVKPEGGVSTAAAYRTFDENPGSVPDSLAAAAQAARSAQDIALFNNLAPASERLMPALADVRTWLESQQGVQGALLCGSGAATFALCDGFTEACRIVAEARKQGWWARATSLGNVKAVVARGEGDAL